MPGLIPVSSFAQLHSADTTAHPRIDSLKEVTVEGKRPVIEVLPDKTVIHVANSITGAGGSALDALTLAPGVSIDPNDNIQLKGRQGVLVMLDGKPTYLTSSDLAGLLKGIPAASIDKLEIMTNPSVRYDASGNAGIINIQLKKEAHPGTNGTLTFGYGQGKYPKANAGFSINNRGGRTNIFFSYNYSYRKLFNHLTNDRRFYTNNSYDGGDLQDDHFLYRFNTHVIKTGIEHDFSKSTSLEAVVTAFRNLAGPSADNLSKEYDKTGAFQYFTGTTDHSDERWNNIAASLNLKHIFDTSGSTLTTYLDYINYWNRNNLVMNTVYSNADGTPYQDPAALRGDLKGMLHIYSIKSDYTRRLINDVLFEAGFKSSLVRSDNNLAYYTGQSTASTFDSSISSHFLYREYINAAYLNLKKEFHKWTLNAGLRAEQTNTHTRELLSGARSDTSYLQLFPAAALIYKPDRKNKLILRTSRRIDRPTYTQLNPLRIYIDATTYKVGNPYLRPQLTDLAEAAFNHADKLIATLTYSSTRDNMNTVFIPEDPQAKISIQTDKNIGRYRYLGLNIAANYQLTPWWNTNSNLTVYEGHYIATLDKVPLNSQTGAYKFSINNNLTFSNAFKGELNLVYASKDRDGYNILLPAWGLSIGVQHTVLHKKGAVRLNVSDIFYSNYLRGDALSGTLTENFQSKRDSRVANLTFSWAFGNQSMHAYKSKGGGADEEKTRAGLAN
ncbi:MAG TPA: outer membrane beta-barrel family protein [Puia sp.]|nr:outer membrane beta-barrel family protein [Puia sp.]